MKRASKNLSTMFKRSISNGSMERKRQFGRKVGTFSMKISYITSMYYYTICTSRNTYTMLRVVLSNKEKNQAKHAMNTMMKH